MAVLLDIKNASKRYGGQVLLDDTSATITDDEEKKKKVPATKSG